MPGLRCINRAGGEGRDVDNGRVMGGGEGGCMPANRPPSQYHFQCLLFALNFPIVGVCVCVCYVCMFNAFTYVNSLCMPRQWNTLCLLAIHIPKFTTKSFVPV